MTIPAEIYTNLSPQERIRAAISAIARDDDAELKTLAQTCPKKTYRMIDAAFAEGMEKLKVLSLAVESDLQGAALDFWVAALTEDVHDFKGTLEASASIECAWSTLLDEMGIDREEMDKFGPGRHSAVLKMMSAAEGSETPELVAQHLAEMKEYLAA